jgi:SAM-dependent methyltransferase
MSIERPRYRTWVRRSRLVPFAAVTAVSLAGVAFAAVSPWFLLFLVPLGIFGWITLILALTVYRLGPRGGDYQRRIHELIVAQAGPAGAGRLLDVGCGSGSLVVKLARAAPAGTVTGVDSWGDGWEYSREQCETNARIEGVRDRTTFDRRSALALGFADGTFDVVVSCMTFHEVTEAAAKTDGVTEALRVLRPGGRYAFLDLFGDTAFYPSRSAVRAAVAAAGGGPADLRGLAEHLPLPFPLRHPKVLRHAMILTGTKAPASGP